ncbi:MAG: helicase-exonuclease AddAB subunit AddA [Alkaliphilus sp.]|nr:helicase-exonuclease AddAB subunit AddA [bacterium AH-315-L21]PHS30126.1 MAG: helicase-exonuclease AddAB subunit AddA [Alkaliphilus sp.]
MTNWTKEQHEAIVSRKSNLLLSAAAGSGKTAVLVERIVRLVVDDKIDIDKLLIVTFTKAAAGEMRERIALKIAKELENTNKNTEHIRKQLTLLNKANISTLHAFCMNVVKSHFHFIGIDPSFRMADTTESTLMKIEAIDEVLEDFYEQGDACFLQLVDSYGGTKDDNKLQEMILKVYNFSMSQPDPSKWVNEKVQMFNIDRENMDENIWVKTIVKSAKISLAGALTQLEEAKEVANSPGGPDPYLPAIENDIVTINMLLNELENGFESFVNTLKTVSHMKLSSVKKDYDQILKENAKELRDKAKKIVGELKDDLTANDLEEYLSDLDYVRPIISSLSQVIQAFDAKFKQIKSDNGILDFNDLEHYTLQILQNDLVAEEYKEKFEHIFVDEYQDSNIVQETIINKMKKKDNLFLVGDVKQSIYRFRLADPSLFISKYNEFSADADSLNRKIVLSKNFRSRKEIIDGINYIFKNIMSTTIGEIDYDEDAYLYQGADFKPFENAEIEVNIIEKLKTDSSILGEDIKVAVSDEELEEMQDAEIEANISANRINELVGSEIYDSKKQIYKKADYRDIALLLRSTVTWAPIFMDVFKKKNIPVYTDSNTGYFDALEISIFLNLLKLVDNKRQDIPLLSVMRSIIGRFTTEELVDIRSKYREGTYFDAVKKYSSAGEGILKDKTTKFLNKLNKWAKELRHMKIDEFIWHLFIDTGYYYYIGAMPGGVQRQANLRLLLDKANQYQQTAIKGLFNFINFIEKVKLSKGDMGAAKILGENDNVVRIMSIHKSKGLEFPIVLVAGLGKKFNLRDTYEDVILHKDLGIAPSYIGPINPLTDTSRDIIIKRETLAKIAAKEKIKIESLSEEMRILYVALTRAKNKLILIGCIRDIPKQTQKWSMKLNAYGLVSSRSCLDWILSVLIKHKDATKLRELEECEIDEVNQLIDESRWKIQIIYREDIVSEEKQQQDKKEEMKEILNNFNEEDCSAESLESIKIQNQLNWKYKHEEAKTIPSKLSVSELKSMGESEIERLNYKIPSLVKMFNLTEGKKKFTGAEKGTIIHFALQHLDIHKAENLEQIDQQLENMLKKELLTKEEINVVDTKMLLNFLESDLGSRMKKAEKVYREIPFNIVKKASEVISGAKNCNDELLIQGVIDCYYVEAGELVLIDYKTDYVGKGQEDKIVENYKMQIDFYAEALQRITKKKVKEKYLYLLSVNRAIRM